MKHIRQLLMAALLLVASSAWAYDFEVDGIYYNITSSSNPYKVEVTSCSGVWYSGDVIIPESVSYGGNDYSVTSIGYMAFYGCNGLTSIVIPNSVTSIKDMAFSDCSGLTSIAIPNSVTSIKEKAFYASGIRSISLSNSMTTIEAETFSECRKLASIEIPSSVTSIGSGAFWECIRLTSILIPNSVTSIGSYAFVGCTSLVSIDIPNSVTSIGTPLFYGCSSLIDVTVDAGNPIYDSRNNCNAIIETESNTLICGFENTIIPYSITRIGANAFYGARGLTSIEIPNSVTSIGSRAFASSGLASIDIPNSVTTIETRVFDFCRNLTSIEIPSSVTSILGGAFGNSGLTSVVVNSDNPVYDSRENCNAVIETESDRLICGCKTSIIPHSVKTIGYEAFVVCNGLTSIEIPNSVITIQDKAFSSCSDLTFIEIPNSVTNIGRRAFLSCSGLTSILLSESVTDIGDYAFSGCRSLTKVVVRSSTPPNLHSGVFGGSMNEINVPLYVPCGCVEGYNNAPGWNIFTNIIETNNSYVVDAHANGDSFGSVQVVNDCENHEATVIAQPNEGCSFLNWTVNGQVVSTDNPYTFVVNEDTELVANFSGTGVEEEMAQEVSVSPNPAKDRVKVCCEEMQNISLFSMDGRRVKTISAMGTNEMEMDLSGLARGLYMIRVETQIGTTVNRKIVVQ